MIKRLSSLADWRRLPRSRKALLAIGCVVVVCGLCWPYQGDARSAPTDTGRADDVEPPALHVAMVACSQPTRALAQARALGARARLHMQRYPFDAASALSALTLQNEAAHCYESAARPALANQAALTSAAFREQVERDYREHRLRLKRAVAEATDVHADTQWLLALLATQPGRYHDWLLHLDRGAP